MSREHLTEALALSFGAAVIAIQVANAYNLIATLGGAQ